MPTQIGDAFTRQPRRRKYDFAAFGANQHNLTDGKVWRLDKGRDYDCGEGNFRQHVRQYADAHGLRFGFQILKNERGPIGVEIAFVPRDAPMPPGLEDASDDTRRDTGPEPGERHGDGDGA